MDITSILKKLDISSFKVFVLRIFGGKDAVYEYIIEKANTAVNALLETNADTVQTIRAKMATISFYAQKYAQYLPAVWMPYAEHVNAAFLSVYKASADNIITTDEGKQIVADFKIAFADYMAD